LPDFTGPKYMQLRAFDGRLFQNSVGYSWIAEETPAAVEPEVPYYMIRSRDWKAGQTFNFALLAQSPHYVTRAADRLIGVFAEYIDFR
jgi:hypothetical protein